MNAGKKQNTPGSETKQFITHIKSSSQSLNVLMLAPKSQFREVMQRGPGESCTSRGLHYKWKLSEFRDSKSFVIGRKKNCPLLQRKTISPSFKAVCYTNIL